MDRTTGNKEKLCKKMARDIQILARRHMDYKWQQLHNQMAKSNDGLGEKKNGEEGDENVEENHKDKGKTESASTAVAKSHCMRYQMSLSFWIIN